MPPITTFTTGIGHPQADPAHIRHAARTGTSVQAQLTALQGASIDPGTQAGIGNVLCALLAATAELLADTAPYALANAPNRRELEAYIPRTCLIPDDALTGLVAGHLGAVLAAAAVRLPLPSFLSALPGLHAHLNAAIARHLAHDPGRGLGFVVDLALRLTTAIGAGDTPAARESVQTLREVLNTLAPKQGGRRLTPLALTPTDEPGALG